MKYYFVYILANINKTVLYIGFTNDLKKRVNEHKNKIYNGFTKLYNANRLVYFEKVLSIEEAKLREKQLKKWNREWKKNLINKLNPEWLDLSEKFDNKLTDLEFIEVLLNSGINRK